MANEHPFQHLFESLGRTPTSHAESVNRKAHDALTDILSVPLENPGRCILLRAPRAGHGKTHLLSRIRHQLGATHEFIPLHASFGSRIDAGSVIDDTLRCLVRQLPASGGLTVLDLVTRRLFASALQPLVGSGEVPCQDREGALTALRLRPVETFDFHHPNAVTAHWARENFEVLGQRLSQELCLRGGLQVREVSFWVECLFRFASAPLEHSNRVSTLVDTIQKEGSGEMERLEALLGLVSQLMRVVLVADDLEGFSSDETAALKFAAFVGGLRQSVDRVDMILSLNEDVWESAFLPRLSGGLADRLSEVVVELEPLDQAEMAALLDSRVPGLGTKVLERIDVLKAGTHARGLIRAAGLAWVNANGPQETETPAPAIVPAAAPMKEPDPVAPPAAPEPPVSEIKETLPEPPAVEDSWPNPEFLPPAPEETATVEPPADLPPPPSPAESTFDPAPRIPEPVSVPAEEFSPAEPAATEFGEMVEQAPVTSFSEPPLPEPEPSWDKPQDFAPAISQPVDSYQPQETPVPVSPPPFVQQDSTPEPEPPVASPFQIAPPESGGSPPPPTVPPFQSDFGPPDVPSFAPEPAPAFVPFESSPAPSFEPQEPFATQPQPPADPVAPGSSDGSEVPPPPTAEDTDRVDDLLRQFRERYGRGSL